MNSVRSNSLRLKYQRFIPSGCKDIVIRKVEFVAKTKFLCDIESILIVLKLARRVFFIRLAIVT